MQANGDVGKAPEPVLALRIVEVDGLAAHHAQTALHQLQGTRQRQQAGVARAGSFRALAGVVELVEPEQGLIALQGHDLPDHSLRCQRQSCEAGIERLHLRADFLEFGHGALSLAHQGHQCIVDRQGQLNRALHRLDMVARDIAHLGALLRAFLPLELADQRGGAQRRQ